MRNTLAFCACLMLCGTASAGRIFYPSGVLRMFSAEGTIDRSAGREAAARDFLSGSFPDLPAGFEWVKIRELEDHTHVHLDYTLFFAGRAVLESRLRLHYNKKGYVDYATNPLPHALVPSRVARAEILPENAIVDRLARRYRNGTSPPTVRATLSYYFTKAGELLPVYEVWIYSAKPLFARHLYVDARSGEVLEEKKAFRFADATHKVYVVHPDRAAATTQTLAGTDGLTVLSDGTNFHVRRMPFDTSYPSVDVLLGTDFTLHSDFDGTNHDQAGYDAGCSNTGTTDCPNQSFDALNVYFHLRDYRNNLDAYLTNLGLDTSVVFSLDPLQVVVNMLAIDLNGVGLGLDEANNAFYASRITDVQGNIRKGLFFLRPAPSSAGSSVCPSTAFFDLARESTVIVHEYQHYITDMITAMVPGGSLSNVGDALHEGYSDYFGASQVNRLNAEQSPLVTEIGEFAFQNCAAFKRDIGDLKVFSNSTSSTPQNDFSDSHVAGWTWASGLWQLREDLGREAADELAVKSLFFLSTNPGFLESIEALVQADQALNAGANVATIRDLFYNQLKFVGSLNTQLFRDPNNLLFEMGFNSCLSVPRSARATPTFVMALLWLIGTLAWGRRVCRE